MTEKDFISTCTDFSTLNSGNYTWKTPSNIALVKYWGKKKHQIPENTSISFTLDACFTLTTLEFAKKKNEKGEKKDDDKDKDMLHEIPQDGEESEEEKDDLRQSVHQYEEN